MANQNEVEIVISAIDQASRVIERVATNIIRGEQQINASSERLLRTRNSTREIASALDDVGMALTGVGAAGVASLGMVVKTAADFEQTMSSVKAVAGATADQMSQLDTLAIKLGKDTKFSAKEAAQGEEELAKAGVKVDDILGGALSGTLDLAAAGQLDVAEASTAAANAINMFSLKGSEVPHVADLLASAANSSSVEVRDLAYSLSMTGNVASNAKMSLDETVATLALMGKEGLRGSDAGTSLKQMLLSLQAPSDKARDVMEGLGLQFYDNNGQMKSMAEISDILKDKMANLTDEKRQEALAVLFGSDAIRAANILYKYGADGIREMTDQVSKSGEAQRIAAEKMNNLNGDIEQLKGSAETITITLGRSLMPALREIAQNATNVANTFLEFSEAHPQMVKLGLELWAVSVASSAFLGPVMMLGGQLPKVFSGVRTLTSVLTGNTIAAGSSARALQTVASGAIAMVGGLGEGVTAMGAAEGAATGLAAGIGGVGLAAGAVVVGAGAAYLAYNQHVVDKQKENAQKAHDLADEYFKLKGKAKPTADEQARMRDILNEIGEKMPEVVKRYDEFGNILEIDTPKLIEYNKRAQESLSLWDKIKKWGKDNIASKFKFEDVALSDRILHPETYEQALAAEKEFRKQMFELQKTSDGEMNGYAAEQIKKSLERERQYRARELQEFSDSRVKLNEDIKSKLADEELLYQEQKASLLEITKTGNAAQKSQAEQDLAALEQTHKNSIEQIYTDYDLAFQRLISKFHQGGENIGNAWRDGMLKALDEAKDPIEKKLIRLELMMHGNSPPKEGPLSKIDVGGRNIGLAWAKGLESAVDTAAQVGDTLASAVGKSLTRPVYGMANINRPRTLGAEQSSSAGSAGRIINNYLTVNSPVTTDEQQLMRYLRRMELMQGA